MLDLSLIIKPKDNPTRPKRVTPCTKKSGKVGGQNLIGLIALTENGAMCRVELAKYTDWPLTKCSRILSDLVRLGFAVKTQENNQGRTIYAAKEKVE